MTASTERPPDALHRTPMIGFEASSDPASIERR